MAPKLLDYRLFQDLPGAGKNLAPRLLAAFGEGRQRYQRADVLQKYAGIAPVTERSGKKSGVHWRWQCPKFMRQTFVEWAGQTINIVLGRCLLSPTARKGQFLSSRRARASVQMDSDTSSLLDDPNTLR